MIHGLAGADVRRMIQDRSGDLWMATYGGGVSRYDGERFYNLTAADGLANDAVYHILEASDGRFWLPTSAGSAATTASASII